MTDTSTPSRPGTGLGYRVNLIGLTGFAIIFLWAAIAVFAPLLIPYPVGKIVDQDYFGPMSADLWLGSDYLGRDMLSRILMGARYTVGISLAAVCIACFTGVTLGYPTKPRRHPDCSPGCAQCRAGWSGWRWRAGGWWLAAGPPWRAPRSS